MQHQVFTPTYIFANIVSNQKLSFVTISDTIRNLLCFDQRFILKYFFFAIFFYQWLIFIARFFHLLSIAVFLNQVTFTIQRDAAANAFFNIKKKYYLKNENVIKRIYQKESFPSKESYTKDLTEYIFRLQGRHHRLLFK